MYKNEILKLKNYKILKNQMENNSKVDTFINEYIEKKFLI